MPTETIIVVAAVLSAFGFFAAALAYASLTSEPARGKR